MWDLWEGADIEGAGELTGVELGDCPQLASVAAGLGNGELGGAFRLEGGGVAMQMSALVHPFLFLSMNIS